MQTTVQIKISIISQDYHINRQKMKEENKYACMSFFRDCKLTYFAHFIVAKRSFGVLHKILTNNVSSLERDIAFTRGKRIARERDRDIARCEKDRKKGRKRYAFKHLCTPWISIALHLEHSLNTRLVYSANERSLADLYIGTMSWPLNLFFSGRKHLRFELAHQSLDFLIIWRASLRPTFQYHRFLKNTETCVTFTA